MREDFNTFPEFLKGGGIARALIRSINWDDTSLGSFSVWPQPLEFSISLILNSNVPMFIFWGSEHILFYNDAYIPALETSSMHLAAMGKKGKEVWKESWQFIAPELDLVLGGKEEMLPGAHLKSMHRQVPFEHTSLSYHLNPIKNAEGQTAGVLVICNETISITAREQLQAQKKLEELNQEITSLFNVINEGFYSKDILNGQYLALSAGCPKIYGHTTEEFFQNPMLWAEVIHPDDQERVFEDDYFLNKGIQTLTEYRIFHKNSSIRWIEVKAIPVLTNGILTRVDGIVTDITDRKLAEQELIKQKEFSESIINSLPGIFYLFDDKGKFLSWNKNFETVFGYTGDEIKKMHPLDMFHADEKELLRLKIKEVFEKGHAEAEASCYTKDGKQIPHYFNGKAGVFEGKTCLIGTGIDLTELVKTKDALERNEKMLSHILNTIPQSIYWKDTSSNYLGCNIVFAKDAGLKNTEDIIGKSDYDLPWKLEEADKYRADDKFVIESNLPELNLIETQQQASGKTVWLNTTKIPMTDINDAVYGVLGIYEDITDRKKAEEDRERMTAELIERNINLKQFSYIVSHNLRSPINKILGLASIFQKDKDTIDPNYRLIRYIVNEATNLDNVVKDLTTIVSFQDLGISVKEEISFEEEFKLIRHSLETEISESNALITRDFKDPASLKSVKGYFYSIMYNLLTNAIKYRSRERPLRIHLKSGQDEKFVYLSVEDNGMGIDLQRHGNEIFGLYNRFHSSSIPGKGMGLNLVKTQAETLGGKVEIQSKPGEGSAFRVYFLKEDAAE